MDQHGSVVTELQAPFISEVTLLNFCLSFDKVIMLLFAGSIFPLTFLNTINKTRTCPLTFRGCCFSLKSKRTGCQVISCSVILASVS